MNIRQSHHYPLVASLVLVALFSTFCFSRNAGYLFPGGDGTAVLINIANLHSPSATAFGVSANLLEGLGDMAAVNYRFEPSYNLALLALGAERAYTAEFHVLVNTLLSLELFLATFVAACCFGFGRLVSLMAAWLTPLLVLPYLGFPFLYPLMVFSPHVATTASENLLVLAAFTRLGRPLKDGISPLWQDGVLGAAILMMMVHMTIWNPLYVSLWLPVQVVLGVGLLFASSTRREVRSKIIWSAGAVLAWAGIFAVYAYGQLAYTATRFWSSEMESTIFADWQFVSTWFRPLEPAGKLLICAALAGLLLALFDEVVRPLAIAVLAMMLAVFLGGALMIHTDVWRGPSPVYVEVFLFPVYAMFAAYVVVRCGTLLRRAALRHRSNSARTFQRLRTIGSVIAVAIIPACAIAIAVVPAFAISGPNHVPGTRRIYGPSPPTQPPIVSMLADRIAQSPGSPFRGRVATILLQNRAEPARWLDVIRANVVRVDHTGNDHYWSGLWPFNIPTLFAYSQVMSPAFFRTAVDLWARPGDKQIRNVVVLRRANATTLALFGVKYVISDAALPEPFRLETTEQTSSGETLFLYEVPAANLGGYSPTEVLKVATFKEALDALSAPAFEGRQTAIVFDVRDELKRTLVPAKDVQIRIEGSGLEISASSSGSSLLILPFEYSRCLTAISTVPGRPAPSIFRADGPLTGLLFSNRLDARIEYFTGPFNRPACRIQDAADFRRLVQP